MRATRDQPQLEPSEADPEVAEVGRQANEYWADDEETAHEEILDDADNEEDTRDQPQLEPSEADPEIAADERRANDAWAGEEQPDTSLEFDAPEQTWTSFFITDEENTPQGRVGRKPVPEHEPWFSDPDDEALDLQTDDPDEWRRFLAELGDDQAPAAAGGEPQPAVDEPEPSADGQNGGTFTAAQDEAEPSVMPPWLADGTWGDTSGQRHIRRPSMLALVTCAGLALLLAGQWIHYNRDVLAAGAKYGAMTRNVYELLDRPLYPDWPLDAYEVTGTEAITGRSSQDALDVLANVVVHGGQPVGLPLIRIVLRDRWTNPVASRVFTPVEYLREFDPAHPLVDPGTALAVEISVADPGTEALGYIVDVCLPRRKTGLECQISKDPFQ